LSKGVYFIAILPPENILREVHEFKCYARDHFNSSRALRSPAHVTLEPPYKWEDDRTGELIKKIEAFEAPISSFTMALRNFAAFPPRVIYVDVIQNQELLQLQTALKVYLRTIVGIESDRPDRPFHPHMTVAFKDLRKTVFPKAWAYFKEEKYERTFAVKSFWLLRHDGQEWQPVREVLL
jgi:2'-5' RNA ligase